MHVATSPKELTLLKAVVDQPADFERKLEISIASRQVLAETRMSAVQEEE